MSSGTHRPRKDIESLRATLGTAAAAIAGGAVGLVLFWIVGPIAWAIMTVGLGAALFGIVALRRRSGASVPARQQLAYWIAWIAMIAIALLALKGMAQ